jgi:hypothetical protein
MLADRFSGGLGRLKAGCRQDCLPHRKNAPMNGGIAA